MFFFFFPREIKGVGGKLTSLISLNLPLPLRSNEHGHTGMLLSMTLASVANTQFDTVDVFSKDDLVFQRTRGE